MDLSQASVEAILFVISVLVGLLGPKPLQVIFNFLHLEGQWAVLGSYVVALLVGVLGLLISGQFFDIQFSLENLVAIAGLLAAAASFAYHRLKDQGKI